MAETVWQTYQLGEWLTAESTDAEVRALAHGYQVAGGEAVAGLIEHLMQVRDRKRLLAVAKPLAELITVNSTDSELDLIAAAASADGEVPGLRDRLWELRFDMQDEVRRELHDQEESESNCGDPWFEPCGC